VLIEGHFCPLLRAIARLTRVDIARKKKKQRTRVGILDWGVDRMKVF
jgi:hypothetical protein